VILITSTLNPGALELAYKIIFGREPIMAALKYSSVAMFIAAAVSLDAHAVTTETGTEGASVTMTLQNPQTIEVVTLTESNHNGWGLIDSGDAVYMPRTVTPNDYDFNGKDRISAAWGIKTNGRFLANIVNDFASIDNNGSPMFGASPAIIDDSGNTIDYPAFVKYETDAAGKKFDGIEITGDKRYEVLPASFKVEIVNLGSITGTATTFKKTQWGGNYYYAEWEGTGQEFAGVGGTADNYFTNKIGTMQVADQLGQMAGVNYPRVQYISDSGISNYTTIVNNRTVAVFVGPKIDSDIASNIQAGTYYSGIKLTVVAKEQ